MLVVEGEFAILRTQTRPRAADQVLVVDPDVRGRAFVTAWLRKAGIGVVTASSNVEAMERVHRQRPAVVIATPDQLAVNGIELCRRLQAHQGPRPIRCVFLTRDATLESRNAATEVGVDDYIVKPTYLNDLTKRIRNLLEDPPTAAPGDAASAAEATTEPNALFNKVWQTLEPALETSAIATETVESEELLLGNIRGLPLGEEPLQPALGQLLSAIETPSEPGWHPMTTSDLGVGPTATADHAPAPKPTKSTTSPLRLLAGLFAISLALSVLLSLCTT